MIEIPKPTKQKKVKHLLSKIKEETEDLAKLLAKKLAGWKCEKCENGIIISGSNCHGSHIIPVSHGNALRFDPMNILCLCYFHHLSWWHKNPVEAGEWFNAKFPDRKKYIDERKNTIVKFKYEDYVVMKAQLLERINALDK